MIPHKVSFKKMRFVFVLWPLPDGIYGKTHSGSSAAEKVPTERMVGLRDLAQVRAT